MNDTDAKRLLRQLQYQHHKHHGTLDVQAQQSKGDDGIPPHMVEQFKKMYGEEGYKKFQQDRQENEVKLQANLPTDMQNRGTYTIVLDLMKNIETAISEMDYKLPLKPVIGTLHTGHMNGLGISVKSSGEYLVLIDDNIFTLALLSSKVIARSVPVLPNGGISTDLEQMVKTMHSSGALGSFYELLMAYLMVGSPGAAKPYPIENRTLQSISQILVDSIEYFALGHEYGHIIRNHLGSETNVTHLYGETVETLRRSWKDELLADGVGLSLMVHIMSQREIDLSLAFWGVDIFFHMMDILEKSAWLLVYGTDEVKYKQDMSSPPPLMRLYSLLKAMEPSTPKEIYAEVKNLSEDRYALFEHAYQAVKPQLLKMHQEQKKPAAIWQEFVQRLSS